jgi:hypothetical protein
MHQGYQAAWFATPADESDPSCWGFAEGSTPRPEPCGRLSEFLLRLVRDLDACAQREQPKGWLSWLTSR